MLFFVKVRIDTGKLKPFALELQNGVIRTHAESSFCLKNDPSVGLNVWSADSIDDLNEKLLAHKKYYKEIIEISEVITPQESFKILMQEASTN